MSDSEIDILLRNEVKELINLVRERRCVWDPTCIHYRNRVVRQKTWHEICGLLDPAFYTLDDKQKNKVVLMRAKKWSNLRLTYSNCRKSGRDKIKPYVHTKALQFLDPILDRKSIIDSMISDDDKETNDNTDFKFSDDDASQQSIEWLNEIDENGDPMVEELTKKTAKRVPNTDDKDISHFLMKMVEKEENEDTAFFKSITSQVSKLTENSKFEFRIEVLKLLNNLRIKDARMARKRGRENSDSETE